MIKGLFDYDAKKALEQYGENVLTPAPRDPWYMLLLDKFKDPLIQILSVAAIVALILGFIKGEFLEPVGIIFAIALAVGIGFWNEWNAQRKFDAMSTTSDDTLVKVYRDGEVTEVARRYIVPGDMVILSAGEEVPADIRIKESTNLKVNESSLTGESKAVSKMPISEGNIAGTYESDFVLKGTIVEEGSAEGLVILTGDSTEIGKTARQASEITDVETPLNKQLNGLADLINKIAFSAAGVLICSLLAKYMITEGYVGKDWIGITNDLLQFIMIAVALIVVAVPEGLPMAVTLALAYSMKRMANANNLIRKMHACETLGATTLILTDKTGTLTQNKMKVVEVGISNWDYFGLNAGVNSTAVLGLDNEIIGNPTEGAIIKKFASASYERDRALFPIRWRQDFSSKTKCMITVIGDETGLYALLKGAPSVVNAACDLPDDEVSNMWSAKGRRVIGFAYKKLSSFEYAKCLEESIIDMTGFTYNGLVAIEDPIRPTVPAAIKEANDAGISVKIVTGDNPLTAAEIGRQANLVDGPIDCVDCLKEGLDLSPYNLESVDVFARTRPEDKLALVKAYQEMGHVVAMTGDGTNDGPALNNAQVGIAMNNGTDVAKNAADIILLDNSFPSIILGVKWGRSLYKNIQHFVLFQLTINVVAILIALCGPFIGIDLPFTATQMLWVNLIMDTFAALALATEPANDIVMKEAPRDPKAFIITPDMWGEILGVGCTFTVILGSLLYFKAVSLTEFFTIFVILQWWNLFNARVYGQNRSIFDGITKNPAFVGISLVILIGQILIVQFGGEMFRTEPLTLSQWGMILGCTSVIALGREAIYQVKKLF